MFENRQIMLTLPYKKLWCEAKPDDMIELDLVEGIMITKSGHVEMDWETDDYQELNSKCIFRVFTKRPVKAPVFVGRPLVAYKNRIQATVMKSQNPVQPYFRATYQHTLLSGAHR